MKPPQSAATADARAILRARARELARPLQDAIAPAACLEVLEFRLGRESYAVEAGYVSEVVPLKQLTPLPSTPAVVLGVINVRGRTVPVYDLKRLFDLPHAGLTDLHQVVIVHGEGLELGLLADTTVGVRRLPVETLQSSLPTLTGIRAEYLKGVTAEHLVVLDVGRLLADPSIIVHDEVDS